MSDADAIIAALNTANDTLAELVPGFTDEDLARTSGAAEWDISQVLSHMGSGAEITRASLEAAISGTARPGSDFNNSVWDRWNAMSRRERADGYLKSNRALIELYNSLDSAARGSLRVDLGFMPAPVDLATAAGLRLREVTLHSWDVRVAFDDKATLANDAVAALLHGKPDMYAWIGKTDVLSGRELDITVTTTEPASAFALHLQSLVSVDFDVPDHPDGTLTLPAEAWLRLVAGRLAPKRTPATVTATGAATLDLLRQIFPGY
ncbi:MAG TPA: maleylpyruvate isomerase family mycothiol-dependent enzyme [Streptosporangiaceae bacterium]|nr:maleylpyruvate isomerase family mycothiol-dependent enzyme [Streptosporangiaceae bacterium]